MWRGRLWRSFSTLRGYPGDYPWQIISAREDRCAVHARDFTPDKTGWSLHHCLLLILRLVGLFAAWRRHFSPAPGIWKA
jgi:hypothetical protein